MKFWELMSLCRSEPEVLDRLRDRPEWSEFDEWRRAYPELVDAQDRERLDFELPDELCRYVLSASITRYRLSEGYLHTTRSQVPGTELSTLEAFDRYGGSFLEEVQERGMAPVPAEA